MYQCLLHKIATKNHLINPKMPTKSEDEDEIRSNLSGSTFKSAESSPKSRTARRYSSTSFNKNLHPSSSHQQQCHRHQDGQHDCYCLKQFYEDDEVCRRNEAGFLEFGIVSGYDSGYDSCGNKELKIFWTLENEIEEQDLDSGHPEKYHNLRLIDRKVEPGDIVYYKTKRGEVLDVSWLCYLRILDNDLGLIDIPCDRLEPVLPYYPGQKLELNGWIGTITSISTEATLMFAGGRTAIIDCTHLPLDKLPYPGRRVQYSHKQFATAGLTSVDNVPLATSFQEDPVEAFVLFLNVSSVQVNWSGRITSTGGGEDPVDESMPSKVLSRSQLKRQTRILGLPKDIDWDRTPEAADRFYQYNVQPTDLVIPDSRKGMEEYMVKKYFDHVEGLNEKSRVVDKVKSKIMNNVSYVVRVLRFTRVVHVKWSRSGKVDKIRSSKITTKHPFQQPFRQIVQRKVSLAPYTYEEYGVTLTRDPNDTVQVQWLTRTGDVSGFSGFRMKCQSNEPVYDIEPHFAYGSIRPKELVYRSLNCQLPEGLFSVGWVRQVTLQGQVIVVNILTKQQHSVFPPEIETTGILIHDSEAPSVKIGPRIATSLLMKHGLQILRVADQLFSLNFQSHLEWTGTGESQTSHYVLLQKAPKTHSFYGNKFEIRSNGPWMRAVLKDQVICSTYVNEEIATIWIKAYSDRLDLFSILMAAPPGTPFEGGLYTFDVQLVPEYPSSPPAVYLTTVLSTNTKPSLRPGAQSLELGGALPPYTLVESLITLQTKLFFGGIESLEIPSSAASLSRREAIKERQDRVTNAQTMVDVLDLMYRMVMDPPKLWVVEVIQYFHIIYPRVKTRIQALLNLGNPNATNTEEWMIPTFPLLPLSEGFAKAIGNRMKRFEELINSQG